jgi:hypothetical protein
MDFKEFLNFAGFFYSLNPKNVKRLLSEMRDPPMLTQKGNELIADPSRNVLVPYGDFNKSQDVGEPGWKKPKSGFMRDAPALHAFAQASPENMAATIIFVLITVRADFMQAMQDFPVIMMMLHTKFKGRDEDNPMFGGELDQQIDDMQTKLARNVDPSMHDKDHFAKGYGLKSTTFGFKLKGISEVWSNRDKNYNAIMNYMEKKDTVGAFKYLIDNVTGLKAVKAGFCIQIMFGKLGCIDMHNINLYSGYAKMRNNKQLYADLEPDALNKGTNVNLSGSAREIEHYLRVLDQLEQEGANTVKLWDIWVNYVAHNYDSGEYSRYAKTGPYAGLTVDPKDPLVQRMMDLKDMPDRASMDPKTGEPKYKTKYDFGLHPGGGTASRAHRTISHYQNKQYWDDILAAAEASVEKDVPPDVRFRTHRGTKEMPFKPLAYIATHPEMADEAGLDAEFVKRAQKVLQRKGLLTGADWRPFGTGGQTVMNFARPQRKGNVKPRRGKSKESRPKKFDRNRGGHQPKLEPSLVQQDLF